MDIEIFQHVAFEGPGMIADWAHIKGHALRVRRMDLREIPEGSDGVIVLGGPMGAQDTGNHPWLGREREFIRQAIDAHTPVLGICLGAQQLALTLGGKVRSNECNEKGWAPVQRTDGESSHMLGGLPREFSPFHWHQDNVVAPPGSEVLAKSDSCAVQAFQQGTALGLQFHLEASARWVDTMCEALGIPSYQFGEPEDTFLLMCDVLDRWVGTAV